MAGRPSAAPPHHLGALTGIRGIAAWFVVLFHLRVTLVQSLPGWALAVADKGYLAVDLFFILSGFVLWYNYGARLHGAGLAGVASFWWRRLARIWPLHGFLLGICLALVAVLTVTGRDVSAYPFAELPLHVLLIQNWGFTSSLAWNDPAWSISCEMGAYILFPLVAGLCHWDRVPSWLLLALAAGLLTAIWQLFALFGTGCLGDFVAITGLGRCLLEFSLGNVLCLLWLRWHEVRLGALWAGLVAAGALVLGNWAGLPETIYIPLCFAGVILALALDNGPVSRLLSGKRLSYLGEISYSTYLSHFLLFVVFKMAFVPPTQIMGLPQMVAFLALVAAASVVLYERVEKPAQRWLNGWAPKQMGRAQAV